ncbi:hypothetical protein H0H87_000863 [Tephrocybe sp. NHM501043]|nr:hypothetical protein H0H87_000863 [Tephrocybe sp. NHM501043]
MSNAHYIYWMEKCSITVERSVRFNVEEEVEVKATLLKEEQDAGKQPSSPNSPPSPICCATIEEVQDSEAPVDHLGDEFQAAPEPEEGCGKHVCKESDYLYCLQTSEGVASNCPSAPAIPIRIQEGSEVGNVAEEEL